MSASEYEKQTLWSTKKSRLRCRVLDTDPLPLFILPCRPTPSHAIANDTEHSFIYIGASGDRGRTFSEKGLQRFDP